MPNPKRRHSNTRTKKRRTHYKASKASVATCPNCHEMKLTHRACPNCGYYNGRYVLSVATK